MGELRWVLLLVALLVLVAVFVWTRFHARLADRLKWPFRGPQPSTVLGNRQEPALTTSSVVAAPALPAKIVTIRILSRGGVPFAAERLVLALREAGLRHGRYGIFHYAASDEEETPIFSAASLTEPGSFDLTRLRTDVYPGISLFMGLPGPVDGAAAFDAMVKAGRGIAKDLEGNVVDELGSTFSIQRERYLREEIIQFQHRQSRPA